MATLILPTTLFESNKVVEKYKRTYIVEHPINFTKYNYHKMKLVFHRSTMKQYASYIRNKYKATVTYIEYNDNLDKIFKKEKVIYCHDPVDHMVTNDLKKRARKYNTELHIIESPMFMIPYNDLEEYAGDKKTYFHHHFYKHFRKKYDILMKGDKPIGNKWSFDIDNRKPFPKSFKESFNVISNKNKLVDEAIRYVEKNFLDNPGSDDLYLPIDFSSAKRHLTSFLKNRYKQFGPYEDAVDTDIIVGNHSLLSPLMNVGLLTPEFVMEKVITYGKKNKVPMQSIEGFVRQLFWREYCRLLYLFKRQELEKGNYFKNTNKLSKNWYDNSEKKIGIDIIDELIEKTLDYGYLHHIERLMYIGNIMILLKIKPKDVFDWFQCMFLDSYHVFMYPNVYGMSQHSAGPIMMRKPYFSSANYVTKMSNYTKHKNKYNKIKVGNKEMEWFEFWDDLYYKFLRSNKSKLKKIYAFAPIINRL